MNDALEAQIQELQKILDEPGVSIEEASLLAQIGLLTMILTELREIKDLLAANRT